ncbi:MAG: Kdo domain containing protein [Saprospirales bacterium]|nr:MAG: Kdo domain containing protein [Saprospirales bacterium]
MHVVINGDYKRHRRRLVEMITDFDRSGEMLVKGKRNTIKIFPLDGKTVNIKAFQIPNAVNKLAYRYLRKSKARRSFEYAKKLLALGINTPEPMAYGEERNFWGLNKSYYLSEHLTGQFSIRQPLEQKNFTNREEILRQFTRFTFHLHEKRVWFLDHSPGNTLVREDSNGQYQFFLVDINRMQFKKLSRKVRLNNFARLSADKKALSIIGEEYAKLTGWPKKATTRAILEADQKFRAGRKKKQRMKRLLGRK